MTKFNFFCIALTFFVCCVIAADLKNCKYDQLYQLGDSLSDTGNYIVENSNSPFAKLPYGRSIRKATGRPSDGLLIVDYIAQAIGIPLINPYKNTNANFRNGDNFATAGATALSLPELKAKNISSPSTSTSLDVQLDLMFTHFNSICLNDCTSVLKNALFFAGEIGSNDYSFALLQGKSFQATGQLTSDVVFAIQEGIKRVIQFGAVRIVVPGILPLGCLPIHLTKFETTFPGQYDQFGCLKQLNAISNNHNVQLQQAIAALQKQNPTVTIIYTDLYNAYVNLVRNAQKLGFDPKSVLKACCGTGGKYNFDLNKQCGAGGVPVCNEPNTYLSWDGYQLTQNAYKNIAQSIINDISPKLKCGA